jgi:S1-C subfamily serine protease
MRTSHANMSLAAAATATATTRDEASSHRKVDHDCIRHVVRVFVTRASYRISSPWQVSETSSCWGSGFVISNRMIVTNAHVIGDFVRISVLRTGSGSQFDARVLIVAEDCDLAILTVDDDDFWPDESGLELADGLVELQASVSVVGFPIGGDAASVTSGVVSRIDIRQYVHSKFDLPAIQIDAAINNGNSGGPIFHQNKVVGVAFQTMLFSSSIGYIIPTFLLLQVIDHARAKTPYRGIGSLGFSWQKVDGPHMKQSLGMSPSQTGVLIARPAKFRTLHGVLRPMDVLLKVDSFAVGDDGTVSIRFGERVDFKFHICTKRIGEAVRLQILRGGSIVDIDATVDVEKKITPRFPCGSPPPYLIFAGLLFRRIYEEDLDAERVLRENTSDDARESEDYEQVCILSSLHHDVNKGSSYIISKQLMSINGCRIRNMRHLCQTLDSCRDTYVDIVAFGGSIARIETQKARDACADILLRYTVPADRSIDLRIACGPPPASAAAM